MPDSENQNAIPVIDVSRPSEAVALQVLEAASTQGFLFIKNDGATIPPKDIDDMFKLSQEFFATPRQHKAEFAIHSEKAGGINRGWVSMQGESLDPQGQKHGDPKQAFNIGPPQPELQPLPQPLLSQKDLISRFQTSCHNLCISILSLLGTALQITDPDYFASRHDQSQGPSGTIFRMLYYPKTAPKGDREDSIRAGAHSDYGSVTLLFRLPGQPGLELLTEKGWVTVPVNPNPKDLIEPPILVNIGDLLSFWTNGMLKSTVHRVTFSSGEERYSMAYFCHPLNDAKLGAVPSEVIDKFGDQGVNELRSQRKRLGLNEDGENDVLTAKQHLDRRLKVTYGI
ncbi:Clavaminate synthase-like protein [Cucurbitaria berberidis CBS 394.84]|uniref:Clavaminate synthase-like protein n=1 Tax=Cucurbitaria berberidis CBS 394.84 TaxID=1168544 RepID=A0A9P4GK00_9PLEO|nr:Clavaminate synthase-like protein [Cucurbitaria berberidis CBS 394.84]KAF1847022.1 Clavaminate synthase-like protein [Cucurbitaria berberidis CBS 394.84]